jgi:twitching motility protein PilT
MIEMINQDRLEHILTIEDPIEYQYQPVKSIIDQREILIDTKDFHSALIAMFRQDINVVLIGEMRGLDTISTAVTAAETGHLVFSTLHTNNASQTIDRIIDSFPADQQQQIECSLPDRLPVFFLSVLFREFPADLFRHTSFLLITVRSQT